MCMTVSLQHSKVSQSSLFRVAARSCSAFIPQEGGRGWGWGEYSITIKGWKCFCSCWTKPLVNLILDPCAMVQLHSSFPGARCSSQYWNEEERKTYAQKFPSELSKDQIPRGAEYPRFLLKSISFRIKPWEGKGEGRELEGKSSVVMVSRTPHRED